MARRVSSSGQLNAVAERAEALRHTLTVVALDLDVGLPESAARAAKAPELRRTSLKLDTAFREPANDRYCLAAAVAAFAGDPDDAVIGRGRGSLPLVP